MKTNLHFLIMISLIWVSSLNAQTDVSQSSEALKVIHNRKSVRRFTGEAISKEALETVLKAGMAAPTARNMQPWAFIVITQRSELDRLLKALPSVPMLEKAGAAIVVCAIPEKAAGKNPEFAVIDSSLASQNILLAIEALGLGAVWTAAYPDAERMAAVRNTLNIPADVIPLNVIPVGHPTGEDKPKDKYNQASIHWEKW